MVIIVGQRSKLCFETDENKNVTILDGLMTHCLSTNANVIEAKLSHDGKVLVLVVRHFFSNYYHCVQKNGQYSYDEIKNNTVVWIRFSPTCGNNPSTDEVSSYRATYPYRISGVLKVPT